MNQINLKEQVNIIREAFGYINQFKGATFVIKLDSTLIEHPFFSLVIKDIALLHHMGIKIVIVPGARQRIDEILKAFHVRCRIVNGTRITSPGAIPFIKMAAFDVSNKIMTLLAENNTHGIIGNWAKARGIGVINGINYQNSGIIEKVNSDIVKTVLDQGMIPIFPNIGWSAKGKPYNISSNELAATISQELRAAKLFFLADFEGITANTYKLPRNVQVTADGIISRMNVTEAEKMLELNSSRKHDFKMELISLAHKACTEGVQRVHIVDGRGEGMILKEIFSSRGWGTMIYANDFENIRPMQHADIGEVLHIMQPSIKERSLLPRTAEELETNMEDYVVFEIDGAIHGCGALHIHSSDQAEVAALAVDSAQANQGIGSKLMKYLLQKARAAKCKEVFVLTTQAPDWFSKAGFKEASVLSLPESKKKQYNKNRNSLVFTYSLKRKARQRRLRVE
ncbi:MAG: amino-acid N-acetyltransferase [Chitinivibrionales bacterium]|nr:amino-acid N-acetyltransferase [Chitinivibrionales bacterium]